MEGIFGDKVVDVGLTGWLTYKNIAGKTFGDTRVWGCLVVNEKYCKKNF